MEKHINIKLTVKELDSLERMIQYLADEDQSLEDFLEEGGKKEDHIFTHRERIRKTLNRQIKNV